MSCSATNTTPATFNPDTHPPLLAHTDGACRGNPGPAGWAVVFSPPPCSKDLHLRMDGALRIIVGGYLVPTPSRGSLLDR